MACRLLGAGSGGHLIVACSDGRRRDVLTKMKQLDCEPIHSGLSGKEPTCGDPSHGCAGYLGSVLVQVLRDKDSVSEGLRRPV
jgi:hypothetical protein